MRGLISPYRIDTSFASITKEGRVAGNAKKKGRVAAVCASTVIKRDSVRVAGRQDCFISEVLNRNSANWLVVEHVMVDSSNVVSDVICAMIWCKLYCKRIYYVRVCAFALVFVSACL